MNSRADDSPAEQSSPVARPPTNREQQLLAIACRLFAQRGYESTSLRDIAEAAKISKATLYHYFSTKEELYEKVVIRSLVPLVQAVTAAVAEASSPTARVKAFVRTAAHSLQTQRDQWLASGHAFREAGQVKHHGVALQLRDTYENLLRGCIEEGVSSGEFRAMDAGMATRFLLSSLNYMTRWHSPEGKLSETEVMEQFVDMALLGFLTREEAAGQSANPEKPTVISGDAPSKRIRKKAV